MGEIYLAGKLDASEGRIDRLAAELETRGHVVLEKWWEKGRLPTPYLDHVDTSEPAAKTMINAAYHSDICILFPSGNILGAAVEFGAAIASTVVNQDKKVIVVNPYEARQSVFYAHPAVVAVRSLAHVRQMDFY